MDLCLDLASAIEIVEPHNLQEILEGLVEIGAIMGFIFEKSSVRLFGANKTFETFLLQNKLSEPIKEPKLKDRRTNRSKNRKRDGET